MSIAEREGYSWRWLLGIMPAPWRWVGRRSGGEALPAAPALDRASAQDCGASQEVRDYRAAPPDHAGRMQRTAERAAAGMPPESGR